MKQLISSDLQTQWNDHFHMRDQTWKVVQYSILFFLGAVGLEIKGVDRTVLIAAYAAVVVTSTFGVFIAMHHRQRQKEKFQIIEIYERELELDTLIKPVLDAANKTFVGRVNTSAYIVVMQLAIALVAAMMLVRALL